MRSRVTCRDVAQRAGVSQTTVSFVLNERPVRIREETRQAVLRAAQELGYQPNSMAQAMKTKRTRTLGLIVGWQFNNYLFSQPIKGIQEVASKHDYQILLTSTSFDPSRESQVIDLFLRQRVDGLIFFTSSSVEPLIWTNLRHQQIPFVLLNNPPIQADLLQVTIDHEQGSRLAVEHLLQLGHSRIGFMGAGSQRTVARRFEGYAKALSKAGIEVEESMVFWDRQGHLDALTGSRLTTKVLASPTPPTAIYAVNDFLAFGALEVLREAGKEKEISLVGHDDTLPARYTYPKLTSIAQPFEEMGRRGCQLLIDLLETGQVEKTHISLPCSINQRETSRRPGS